MSAPSLDPDLALDPNGHFFYQFDKAHQWRATDGRALGALLAGPRPPLYRTALGTVAPFSEGVLPAFHGPMYADLDVSPEQGGTDTAISQMNALLDRLEALDVNLNTVRIFASGGKGFHLEIPQETFSSRPIVSEMLPQIYRAAICSRELFVDGVDLNVYSARMGRMWRVPNRVRENGRFKVPVSADQVRNMTASDYARLTSCPQPWPRLQPAQYSNHLAIHIAKAQDAVRTKQAKRPKVSREAEALKARFGGKLPPSVAGLLQGRFQPAQIGWNQVCIQVALVAHAVGVTEDDLILQAQGLILGHHGDGSRYASGRDREAELRKMFGYVIAAGYQFSVGGLRSVIPASINCRDLRGLDHGL